MTGKDRKKQQRISDFASVTKGAERSPVARRREDTAPHGSSDAAEMVAPAPLPNADLATVLSEIQHFRTEISAKSDRLEIKMDLFQNRCNAMEERIKHLEERLSSLEDGMPTMTAKQTSHENAIKALEIGLDGQENRGRRNNVRLVGLPEGSETGAPTVFFEKLLRELLPNASYTTFYSVVRAHRTLGPRPAPGAPPRAVLVRFLHFRDRDAVMNAAREMGEVRYSNVRLHFYQDLSVSVQRERKKFDTAKQMLRDKKIKYGMMFPARLRVESNGKVLFFTDPRDACSFAENTVLKRGPHRDVPTISDPVVSN